eukprot:33182-Alexandrium_andersonii.AAC.1
MDSGVEEPPKGEKELLFEQASSGGFDMRGTIGGWWQKALKESEELAQQYKEVGRGYSAQRAFRQRLSLIHISEPTRLALI